MIGKRGDLPSKVGVGSHQGNERHPIRGGGRREICERGIRLLLHLRHCDLVLVRLTDVGGVAGSLRGDTVIPCVLKYFGKKYIEVCRQVLQSKE